MENKECHWEIIRDTQFGGRGGGGSKSMALYCVTYKVNTRYIDLNNVVSTP